VLAYFALAWTGWGLSVGVLTTVEALGIAAAGLCFLVLVGCAVVAYRRAMSLPTGHDIRRGRKTGRRFGIIVAAEFIGLSVAAAILTLSGHPNRITR
jgi:membrane protein implicated in regulation of membrane protease activity